MEQTTIDAAIDARARTEPAPVSAGHDQQTGPRLKISARFLLAIYAILPVCVLAMTLDQLFWNRSLFSHLPTSPEHFFVFQLLFGTPHIIASTFILATNTNYLRAYWLRLLLFTLLILVFFGVGSKFIPFDVFLALVGAATILHVIKQQVGVGRGMARISSRLYEVWGWVLIAFGSILYYAIYSRSGFSAQTAFWVHSVVWSLAALIVVLTIACHMRIATTMGRLYLWANTVMALLSGFFYAVDYPFLAILGPRLVHDVTAFTFYIAHDVNRHGTAPQNLVYRLASKLGLGVFWVCPAAAILLTYLIERYAGPAAGLFASRVFGYDVPYGASFLIVGYLGLLHYYTEAFTWRKGSPYRPYFALAA